MSVSNRAAKVSLRAAVTLAWRNRFDEALTAAGLAADFHASGDGLAQALRDDWQTDVVILDLALASPALTAQLGPDGPALIAFGDPDHAGVALAGNLVDFIADAPSDADLLAAVEAALGPGAAAGVFAVAELSDRTMARLGSLGAEATRVAEALSRLDAAAVAPPPPLDLARLRATIRARRARDRFFPADLFGEPAWDMLLDLAIAGAEGRDVAVSSLCIAAAVPTTTALRWIKTLCDAGLFERRDDPLDARRAFISLSPAAEQAMARYLAQTVSPWP